MDHLSYGGNQISWLFMTACMQAAICVEYNVIKLRWQILMIWFESSIFLDKFKKLKNIRNITSKFNAIVYIDPKSN